MARRLPHGPLSITPIPRRPGRPRCAESAALQRCLRLMARMAAGVDGIIRRIRQQRQKLRADQEGPGARGREAKFVSQQMIMRPAVFMSDEMIGRLFEQFKNDHQRWEEFGKREFPAEPYSKENTEPQPGRAAIVLDFVSEQLGTDHPYEVGRLIIRIQKAMHGFWP